jgi:two-component system sensor histidine kinase KdpD
VGKTYAMLEQARARQRQGIEVVAGWIETHGRAETEALREGIEALPPKEISYRGTNLREFDLDGALARRPALVLLDELAHTNAPGSRHAKRWQDAEELLAAGIDVYSTVNIQHVESLNDVVTQTTGVVVRETIPDHLLDRADEVELIDLTPDDLLERLREGKVYVPAQAELAQRGFFTRGNLIALRELSLRRAAERVDADLRSFRGDQEAPGVWPVAERLLVCISANPAAARVVRSAARMAASLRAEWIVAHVEHPGDPRATDANREQLSRTLRLAEQLGAETTALIGLNVSEELLAYARSRNVTKIVIGKPAGSPWRYRLLGSVVDDLVRRSNEIDVYVIRGESDAPGSTRLPGLHRSSPARRYPWVLLSTALTTGICALMDPRFDPSNLAMIYLLNVVFAATVLGRGPSILATILGVAAFDFFFVPPRLTMAVSDGQYLVTFAVMLTVALLTSTFAVRLRQQAEAHRQRQERTAALYRTSREFALASTLADVVQSVENHLGSLYGSEAWVLLPDAEGRLAHAPGVTSAFPLEAREHAVAQWVHEHGQLAGLGTETLGAARALYAPLKTARGTIGVLGLFPSEGFGSFTPERVDLLEAFASQAAVVIERALLAEEAQRARVSAESERLRNLLLSSVSHDLRTPLATITGSASSLLEGEELLSPGTRRELTKSILDEGERLNRLLGDLLSMTRIESGGVEIRREWMPLEEVVGAALNHLERVLEGRPVRVDLPDHLPLLPLDGVLIEQLLVNLLENASKYAPPGTPIEISARLDGPGVSVEVADRGPGLPVGEEERVFEKFYRAPGAGDRRGSGLGLPICRGIVEAHGGTITAANRAGGGASFRFHLPAAGLPPTLEEEEPDA